MYVRLLNLIVTFPNLMNRAMTGQRTCNTTGWKELYLELEVLAE